MKAMKTLKASDLMTSRQLWTCHESSPAREAAELMAEHDIGAVPIIDDSGKLCGIVTDRDICCRLLAQGKDIDTPVSEIMSSPVHTVGPDADLKEIESAMEEFKIRRLPVVDAEGKLHGMISLADLARHARGLTRDRGLAEVLGAISTPD